MVSESKSALHVEDDETWKGIIGRSLQRSGYEVTHTDNLQDAVGYARDRRFDLYVIDGRFPPVPSGRAVGGAGLQLYERIRQMVEGDLNYVIISSDSDLEKECDEKGIKFIDKGRDAFQSFQVYLETIK